MNSTTIELGIMLAVYTFGIGLFMCWYHEMFKPFMKKRKEKVKT